MGIKGISVLAIGCIIWGLTATAVNAQLNRGIIEGIVIDPQGASIAGADVTVTSVDTNVASATRTNNTGYYRAVDLVPGKYRVHIAAAGFNATDVVDVAIPAGQTVKVDAQMKLGSTQETVQVVAEVPLLETTASNFSHAVENRTIQEFPCKVVTCSSSPTCFPGLPMHLALQEAISASAASSDLSRIQRTCRVPICPLTAGRRGPMPGIWTETSISPGYRRMWR